MTLGPARRSPAEQKELSVQLMPLFDSLDPRVRQALHNVDVDLTDLIEIVKLDPDYALKLIREWEAHDRANAIYAY